MISLLPYSLLKEFPQNITGVMIDMHGYRKFCLRGSNFDFFLSLMGGGRMKIPLLAGHHRPARETPFKRCFTGVPMMALY